MSVNASANEAQFFFFSSNLPDATFNVIDFTGEEAISSPYVFSIKVISNSGFIAPDDVLGHPATFYLFRRGQYYPYSGIVTEIELCETDFNNDVYLIKLMPSLWLTNLSFRTRIFQNMTVAEVIQQVLNESNISNYSITSSNSTQHEYIVQYQETDLNFISRLMECTGLWYYFEEHAIKKDQVGPGASQEKLIITDNSQFVDIVSPAAVPYRPISGMAQQSQQDSFEFVSNVQFKKGVIASQAVVKTYNYRTPEISLLGKQPVENGTVGTVYEYGGSFKNVSDAQKMSQLLSKRIQSQQIKITGISDCRGFRAGYRFELQQHHRSELCIPYVITAVRHAGGVKTKTYDNKFEAIPNDQARNYAPAKKTKTPKVHGVITAQVEANGSNYASIDDKGRYKVRLPFDLSSNKNDCTGSKYIRLAQPYSGSQYGIHFPSHQGTEIVLACVDGDPNKPIGIGTVPNANTISPVIANNKHENIIKTAGGNVFIMDDTVDKQKVSLRTNGLHRLEMNDESKSVLLSSTDLNQLLIDDKNSKVVLNSNTNAISMSYGDNGKYIELHSGGGHLIKIDDQNKIITIKTSGGHQIDLDDQGKKIVMTDGQGKNTVTLDGNDGLIINTNGKLSISAKQDIEISGANIKINSTQGKTDIKATSDLTLSGINISQNGSAGVKIEAAQFEAKGNSTAKVQGAMVEVKADANLKVGGGVMAELSGGGMTTVKGGMVMIN